MFNMHGAELRPINIICLVFNKDKAIGAFHMRLMMLVDKLSLRYAVTVRRRPVALHRYPWRGCWAHFRRGT